MKKTFYLKIRLLPNILLLLIAYCTLIIPSARDCYSQWITQNSGTTQHLYDVHFINTQTGWACGNNGTMLKTTNGGNSWIAQNSGITRPIYSIHFVNDNIGYSVSLVTGYFLKTTNGGENWFTTFVSANSFRSIYFADSLTGWASGTGGTGWVYRTINGGVNWDSVSVSTGTGYGVQFINQNTGWCCIGSSIYKSTNAGLNWFQQFSNIGLGDISSLSFLNENTGYAVSESSARVYKTKNSGKNWIFLAQLSTNAHTIFFINVNKGWFCGDFGYMFSTTNGGLNWYQQNTLGSNFLNSVYFTNDTIGWSVGGGGKIIYTSNGGSIIGITQSENVIPVEYKLYQNYPNPFNQTTVINYELPVNAFVSLKIYNILGKEISNLVNKKQNAGNYSVKFESGDLSSGMYFCKLIANNYTQTIKISSIK